MNESCWRDRPKKQIPNPLKKRGFGMTGLGFSGLFVSKCTCWVSGGLQGPKPFFVLHV